MRRRQGQLKDRVTSFWRKVQFGGHVLINYSFLLVVGILLLYTVMGQDLITDITTLATQIIAELISIGPYRLTSAVLAILLFIIGFTNQNWQRRQIIVATAGLLALVTIPAIFVLLGQLVLSNTELQLVANAFQSAGSLLLVVLTLSYVVATRDMHKSNWEMIFDRRKEHYRPTAKRIVTDFIDPLRRIFAEQEPILIYAKNGRLQPLPCKADLPKNLIEDMESLEYLKQEHERKRRRIKSYSLDTISFDASDYRRWQIRYEDRYERVFEAVREGLYDITVTSEGPLDLTEEEAQIVQNRLGDLTKYLLEGYPVWQHEIEHDPELAKVYPKLDEERQYFLDQADPHFEHLMDLGEDMLEVNMKFITKPNKIAEWRGYIMEEYYLSESEV